MRAFWGWPAAVVAMVVVATGIFLLRSAAADPPAPNGPLPAADLDLLHHAQQVLLRDCMASQGFRYWPMAREPYAALRDFPYVVDDLAWAKSQGYGRQLRAALDRQDRTEPNSHYYRALPPERRQAAARAINGSTFSGFSVRNPLGGVLSHSWDGCDAESWRQLYGNAEQWYQSSTVVRNLGPLRIGEVRESTEFRTALGPWSACMRRAGFAVADPAQLRDQRAADNGGTAPAADVRAATAEATCALSSGLAATARKLDLESARRLNREHAADYQTMWRLQAHALAIAKSMSQ